MQALFLSPKNNVEGALAVLNAAGCDIWVKPHEQPMLPLVEAFTQQKSIIHTSGTTGTPKPISWTHGLIGSLDAVRLLPPTEGDYGLPPWTDNWNEGDTIYSSFPMSHVGTCLASPSNQ